MNGTEIDLLFARKRDECVGDTEAGGLSGAWARSVNTAKEQYEPNLEAMDSSRSWSEMSLSSRLDACLL
jgi:hypothetical protein